MQMQSKSLILVFFVFLTIPVQICPDVLPLLATKWGQDAYFNEFCPADTAGPDDHAWAGCAATAMAQIMKYWNYPERGTGSNGYESPPYGSLSVDFCSTMYKWAEMEDSLAAPNPSAAELLYHCGIASDTKYGWQYSSTAKENISRAFKEYFDYYQTGFILRSWFPDSEWVSLVKNELDSARPVFYNGGTSITHYYILDGYRGDNYFHVNWGWGGNHDGYYHIDGLIPGGGDYNANQCAMIGLKPNRGDLHCNGVKVITQSSGIFTDGSIDNNYTNECRCRWLIRPPGASFIHLSFNRMDTEQDNDFVTVYDGDSTGAPVLLRTSGDGLPLPVTSSGGQVLVEFISDNSTTGNGWQISFTSEQADIHARTQINTDTRLDLKVFPQPSTGPINIQISRNSDFPLRLSIATISGQIVYQDEISKPGMLKTMDFSGLGEGIYFAKASYAGRELVRKFIICR
jgi:hypothetical protein